MIQKQVNIEFDKKKSYPPHPPSKKEKANIKRFDDNLYKKYDIDAKQKIIKFFKEKKGMTLVEGNRYGIDLHEITGSFFVEVEVKESWNNTFNFDTLHIPYRKKKFITGKTFFCVLNKEKNRFLLVHDSKLNNKHEVKNKYVENGEYFYDIPINQCREYIC